MSYNGYSNWVTWEIYNNFGNISSELFESCANENNSEKEARENFVSAMRDFVDNAVDLDLRQHGLDSAMTGIAAKIEKIDYDNLFDKELKNNPDIFAIKENKLSM